MDFSYIASQMMVKFGIRDLCIRSGGNFDIKTHWLLVLLFAAYSAALSVTQDYIYTCIASSDWRTGKDVARSGCRLTWGILLGVWGTLRTTCRYIRCPGTDSKRAHPEYKSEAL
jgi:hypothetical protein